MKRFMDRCKKSQPDPEPRLRVKLHPASNGEFEPAAIAPEIEFVRSWSAARVERNARRLGLSRRRFLMTPCAAATTLLAMNEVFGRGGRMPPVFDVTPAMELDSAAAADRLAGNELIFDVQTHHVNPDRASSSFVTIFPYADCGESNPVRCFSLEHYIKEVFLDSDTTIAVLSAVPATPGNDPLSIEEAAVTGALLEIVSGSPRLLLHGLVIPSFPPLQERLDGMQQLVEQYPIKAWKTYTHVGPNDQGWFLDDLDVGIPFIQKARETGVKVICIHKGLSASSPYSRCRDVGVVARLFPDVTFIIYHSGFEEISMEGAYDPASLLGIDTLIRSLQANGIAPNSNVYAELGTTWREVMRNPEVAVHVIGKLLKYVGEDRLLWGTDSIWFGSPQDQIEVFRAFQIPEPFQELYGYPALTPALKAKVFGLSAAVPYGLSAAGVAYELRRDAIERRRIEYRNDPQPSFATYGPRTRREFLDFLRLHGGMPG